MQQSGVPRAGTSFEPVKPSTLYQVTQQKNLVNYSHFSDMKPDNSQLDSATRAFVN